MKDAYNPSTWEVDAERSGVPSKPGLHESLSQGKIILKFKYSTRHGGTLL